MKLKIKNLGIIKSVEADLSKDFIILTGTNNTGKTYLSYLIYGFYALKGMLDDNALKKLYAAKNIRPEIEIDKMADESLTWQPTSYFFFPAERSAINLYHTEIISGRSKMWERFSNNKFLDTNAEDDKSYRFTPDTMPNMAYLHFIYDNVTQKLLNESPYSYIATDFETLIGGKIDVKDTKITFQPQSEAVELDIHVSSSTVKSLLGLVFYFRYWAQKGDIIFIDEPELNLHPENQRRIAHLFAKIVNSGIKIVMSTHSDYITKELSSLILLNHEFSQKQEITEKYHISPNEFLNKDIIGVYNFSENGIVEPLAITDFGIEINTFDTQIDAQSKMYNEIYFNSIDNQ